MYLCDSSKTYINFQQSRLFSTAPISRRKFAILSSLSLRSSCNLGLNSDKSDEPFLIAFFISVSNFFMFFEFRYFSLFLFTNRFFLSYAFYQINCPSYQLFTAHFFKPFHFLIVFIIASPQHSDRLSYFSKCDGPQSKLMERIVRAFCRPFSGCG